MIIVEPKPTKYAKEQRLAFVATDPSGPHVVVAGHADTGIKGVEDDSYENYEVRLIVGPWLREVTSVVYSVTVAFYENSNADEDDQQGWIIGEQADLPQEVLPRWQPWTIQDGIHDSEERIQLNVRVAIKGENSRIYRLAYYLTARARQLGGGGLNSP